MSPDDKGDEDTESSFLSRWSQRKREATLPDADGAAAQANEDVKASPAPIAESIEEEEFDLSSLPKLEDVTATTDITGFLRKGVPESLRNAALRKSWALDPAIRNYVNPALDYAYDWNTPGGVPGNSELAAGTDIAKMVLQIMGSDSAATAPQETDAQPPSDATDGADKIADNDAPQNQQPDLPLQQARVFAPATALTPVSTYDLRPESTLIENTPEPLGEASASQQEVRRHGTAKPRA